MAKIKHMQKTAKKSYTVRAKNGMLLKRTNEDETDKEEREHGTFERTNQERRRH